jgi:hypothetical protein
MLFNVTSKSMNDQKLFGSGLLKKKSSQHEDSEGHFGPRANQTAQKTGIFHNQTKRKSRAGYNYGKWRTSLNYSFA